MIKFKQEGVWTVDDDVVHFTDQDVAFLEREAPKTEKRRARICAHQPESRMHQMLIAFCRDSWNPPHAHEAPESMFVLKGMMTVSFPSHGTFSARLVVLHAGEFIRIPAGVVHQPLPVTDAVVLESAEK